LLLLFINLNLFLIKSFKLRKTIATWEIIRLITVGLVSNGVGHHHDLKGVMRSGNKDKLSPRYIGPLEVLERVGETAYILSLTPNL